MAKLPTEVPDAAEFGLLRAYLAQQGFAQGWINSIIGTIPAGQTRKEITDKLRGAMRLLPKAQ